MGAPPTAPTRVTKGRLSEKSCWPVQGIPFLCKGSGSITRQLNTPPALERGWRNNGHLFAWELGLPWWEEQTLSQVIVHRSASQKTRDLGRLQSAQSF